MGRQQGSLVSWYHPFFKWSALAICTWGSTWVWNNTCGKMARFYIDYQTQLKLMRLLQEVGRGDLIWDLWGVPGFYYKLCESENHPSFVWRGYCCWPFLLSYFFMGCLSFSVSLEILPYCCKCRTLVQTKSKHSKWESS